MQRLRSTVELLVLFQRLPVPGTMQRHNMRHWLCHMAETLPATYLTTECCSLNIQINLCQGEEKYETAKSKTVEVVTWPWCILFLSGTSLRALFNIYGTDINIMLKHFMYICTTYVKICAGVISLFHKSHGWERLHNLSKTKQLFASPGPQVCNKEVVAPYHTLLSLAKFYSAKPQHHWRT